MVKAFHAAGMEVIIDVVYNHTAEGGSDGCILCFKGFDNGTYYRLDPANRGRYVDYTGTQNTLNAEHPMVRRMILDSLECWVREMHVDGFRFDLAPALLREGATVNSQSAFIESVRGSPVLSGVKLISEPWDIGEGGYQLGRFPSPWCEWNDRYRDSIRDFWRGHGSPREFARRLTGSPDVFLTPERCPWASINYVTCHDGFTLHDLVSYETRHNEANLEENRDGQQDNHSWNCGAEGESDKTDVRALREKQMRNLLATLLMSKGTPMILAGDEFGRTQRGNNNAYCHDNELSWLQWGCVEPDLKDFVASLIRIRSTHPALYDLATWYKTDGLVLGGSEWDDPNVSAFQIHFTVERPTGGTRKTDNDLIVLVNRSNQPVLFNLPPPVYGKPVQLLLHSDSVAALSWTAYTNRISMPAHSLAIASCG
jgi:isoamylase